jgi:hypothetical protein
MPFTVREFPGQLFHNMEEYSEARIRRTEVEADLSDRAKAYEDEPQKARVTATVISAPNLVEKRVAEIEVKVEDLIERVHALSEPDPPARNKEGLQIGTTLCGESKGNRFTLEVIEDGYLCSNGNIYDSLSGAALGVSGNRRSGWVFWKDIHGTSIGEVTGRLSGKPKNSHTVS